MKFIAAIILSLFISSSVAADDAGQRQTLILSETQRGHIQKEMRALLSGIQNILAALSMDDMASSAKFARPLGMGMAHKAEEHLKGVLPKDFMQLGMSVHQDFDQIAKDAESQKDPKLSLRQLSNVMTKCVACHATYQINTAANPLNNDDDHNH